MATVMQWPLIKARLVVLLPTLSGWSSIAVYPGELLVNDVLPARYATVGYTTTGESGSCRFTQADDAVGVIETGTVAVELCVATGDSDIALSEMAAWAALDGVNAAVHTDRRLGVLSPDGTSAFTVTAIPTANADGTRYLARFALEYQTVTY